MITCINEKCRSSKSCTTPLQCSGAGPEVDAAVKSFAPPKRDPMPIPTDFGIDGPFFPNTRAAWLRVIRTLALIAGAAFIAGALLRAGGFV